MFFKPILTLVFLILTCNGFLNTQIISNYSIPSYINTEVNFIHYADHLSPFWEKLYKLKKEKKGKLNIVHIGDSHLQAGYSSNEFRALMQKEFGHAGRGLIFPYQVAKTNSPYDFSSKSNLEWQCSRNVQLQHNFPVGICGYSIKSPSSLFSLDVELRNRADYFNKVTIFSNHESSEMTFKLIGSNAYGTLDASPHVHSGCFVLPELCSGIKIQGKEQTEDQFILQGIVLENNESNGILYHGIGVNGATYYSYNRSADFAKQLAMLNPDLIIVSLGSNEAYDPGMSTASIYKHMQNFIEQVKTNCGNTEIIVATPPDLLYKSRYKTKNCYLVGELMHDLAKNSDHISVWDFYQVMGGFGSITRWTEDQLAGRDKIHFTVKGYQLMGQLLYQALMKSYLEFEKKQEYKQ